MARSSRRVVAGAAGVLIAVTVAGVARPTTAGGTQAVPAAPSRPRVVLFGDSVLSESSGVLRASLRARKPTWDVEVRAFPGTGICTWLEELETVDARVVAMLFTGVYFTGCVMGKRRWPEAYRTDARTAASILHERGIPVIWLGWPRPAGDVVSPRLDDTIWGYYQEVATEFGDPAVDPGLALFDPASGSYPLTMPCLTPREEGCVDGRVPVRDVLGGHLCPVRDIVGPCPVYSSGVRRFGIAAAGAVADLLPPVAA